ncbi:hypothetical protein HK101_007558 [Irineochytrium annulatum]|nr:hypothetical protein HK101_007558 [Irineochytrium annulatum]
MVDVPSRMDAVHWSRDNMIAVVGSALHVITPGHSPHKLDRLSEFKRNAITTSGKKKFTYRVMAGANDGNIRASDVRNESFFQMVWSPLGCSERGGCVALAVTTSHLVGVWEPMGDPAESKWSMVYDLSDVILALLGYNADDFADDVSKFNKIETMAVAWSETMLIPGKYHRRYSIVACGSKGGTVTLFIGEIVVYRISGNLTASPEDRERLGDGFNFTATFFKRVITKYEAVVSLMKFYTPVGGVPRLAIAKGPQVWFWYLPPDPAPDPLAPDPAVNPVDLPVFITISGLVWGVGGDELRVYTVDGKVLLIACEPDGTFALMEDLTDQFIRQIFFSNDAGGDDEDDDNDGPAAAVGALPGQKGAKVVNFHGAAPSAGGLMDAVLFRLHPPFSIIGYTTNAKAPCCLAIFRPYATQEATQDEDMEQALIAWTLPQIKDPALFYRNSADYLLYDVVEYAFEVHHDSEDAFLFQYASVLRAHYADSKDRFGSTNYDGVQSLSAYVFLYYASDLFLKGIALTSDAILKQDIAVSVEDNSRLLMAYYADCIVEASAGYLCFGSITITDSDALMLLLLSDWALLVLPRSRTIALRNLLRGVTTTSPQILGMVKETYPNMLDEDRGGDHGEGTTGSRGGEVEFDPGRLPAKEACAACSATLPFESPWEAVCGAGHRWERCMVTFLTAATPTTLTCPTCRAKTLTVAALKESPEAPQGEMQPSSILFLLLKTVRTCIYCGNTMKKV